MKRRSIWLAMLLAVSLAAVGALWPGKASATVTCSFTGASIAFAASATATGSLGYSCSSTDLLGDNFTLCSTLGTPSAGTTSLPAMTSGANQLGFNLYTDNARTHPWNGSTTISTAVSIPASLFGTTVTGSVPFYGTIPGGQSPPAGAYMGAFGGTIIGVLISGSCNQSYSNVLLSFYFTGASSSLSASATPASACSVSAAMPLSLGMVSVNASGVSGSTTIAVNCSNGTPYYVGLLPANLNTSGLGTLSGTGINPDHPAYQLRSVSNTGPVWGNTATSTAVGNGVAGTGTGATQTLTAYATLPSANYTPDSYSDMVTVNVSF